MYQRLTLADATDAAAQPLSPTPPAQQGIVGNLVTLLGAGLQLANQQKLSNMNLKLIAAGKPPIQAGQVPGLVPTAQVNVGVSTDTKMILLYGAAGLGAFFLLTTLMKKGRK